MNTKKRILIVSKFYYRRGGDCIVALNTESLLRTRGHEVAVFAMQYPDNIDTPWKEYFPSEVSFAGGAGAKLRALARTMGIGDVKRQFEKMLIDFRPDVVHLHNIHSYLSPVVAALAKKHGAKVVWTMHDYKLLCPSYACRREGKVCELCFHDKSQVVRKRCMKGSLAASAIAWMEAKRWNHRKLERITDTFICPSEFIGSKLQQGGFSRDKIATLCNFIPNLPTAGEKSAEPYYCYVGRLSEEKGVATLLEAATEIDTPLMIAGDGPLGEELRKKYGNYPHIHFLGFLDATKVAELLSKAALSVIPSEWYENNPMGVIESLCCGTPVVGARIGGIPELIGPDGGTTFESGNVDDLRQAVRKALSTEYDYKKLAAESQQRFRADTHYDKLMDIYN